MKKKTWYVEAWDFLDKRKTAIGTVMLFASQFVAPHTVGYQILFYGGTLLGGVGIMHKAAKREFTK
jgi:uncharacterized protein GlcG (DUF336 family)